VVLNLPPKLDKSEDDFDYCVLREFCLYTFQFCSVTDLTLAMAAQRFSSTSSVVSAGRRAAKVGGVASCLWVSREGIESMGEI